MQRYTFLALAIALSLLPIGVSANQINLPNSPEIKPAIAQQLELAQHFFSGEKLRSEEERINTMLQQLDLSAKQSRQIDKIKQEFKAERDTLEQQVNHHRQEMRILLATDTSSDRLRQDYQENQSLLERLGNNLWEMTIQIRATLTPEQRSQLWTSMQQNRN